MEVVYSHIGDSEKKTKIRCVRKDTICSHCHSTESPLWRRGPSSEILCNACGLYWRHHGTPRPVVMFKPSKQIVNSKGAGEADKSKSSSLASWTTFNSSSPPCNNIKNSSKNVGTSFPSHSTTIITRDGDQHTLSRIGDQPEGFRRNLVSLAKKSVALTLPSSSSNLAETIIELPYFMGNRRGSSTISKSRKTKGGAKSVARRVAISFSGRESGNSNNDASVTSLDKAALSTSSSSSSSSSTNNNGNSNGKSSQPGPTPGFWLKMADGRLRTEPVFPLQSQQTTEKTTSMTKDSQPAQKSCYYTLPNGARLAPARVMSFAHDGSGIPYDNESGGDDESNDDEMSSEDENSVTRYLMIRGGKMLLVGDHVAVQGDDENIYYAIVRGLWMSAEGAKIVSLQWLLPRPEHALDIDGPPENILPSFSLLDPFMSD